MKIIILKIVRDAVSKTVPVFVYVGITNKKGEVVMELRLDASLFPRDIEIGQSIKCIPE